MILPVIKRGSAELAVLVILSEGRLHGYEIAKRIEVRTGGVLRFTLASLYPLLYNLEKRGFVRGAWETTKSGRRRRCYVLTSFLTIGKISDFPKRKPSVARSMKSATGGFSFSGFVVLAAGRTV